MHNIVHARAFAWCNVKYSLRVVSVRHREPPNGFCICEGMEGGGGVVLYALDAFVFVCVCVLVRVYAFAPDCIGRSR